MAAQGIPERAGQVTSARAKSRLRAEPAPEPEGITRRVVLNVLEAFFRRPWLYLLPLVLLIAAGVANAAGGTKEFRSVGTLNATTAQAISELTEAAPTPGFTFETPASITSRQINQQLRTQEFLVALAEEAGIPTTDANRAGVLGQIGASLFAFADGDNLVRVGATTGDPAQSQLLASSAITTFIQKQIDLEVSGSKTAEDILSEQILTSEQAVTDAREALRTYVIEQNVGETPDRLQQLELNALTAELERADLRLTTQRDQLAAAQLRTGEATTVVQQRLRVVDPAEVPGVPEPRFQKAVFTMALFGVLGVIVSLALLVLAAALDRTVRVPNDVTAKLGLDVLAVVPNMGR